MTSSYREYATAGQHLLTHHTLLSPLIPQAIVGEPSALMPPLYVGFVAVVYHITGIESYWSTFILKTVNALASTIVVWLAFLISRRLTSRSSFGWIAAVIVTINPTMIGFTDYIWDTSLFTFAVTFTIWIALNISEQPFRWFKWMAYGLWLGGLALLNPALTVTYPLLVLWPLHRAGCLHSGNIIRAVTFSVCGWLIAIAPWTVRNYLQLDTLMYIRSGLSMELWLGVCPEADENGASVYKAQFPLNNLNIQSHVAKIGEYAFIKECGSRAAVAIKKDPIRFLRLVAIRIVDYWSGSTISHAPPGQWGWPQSKPRVAIFLFLFAEVILLSMCIIRARHTSSDLYWLAGIMLLFSIVYCVTHVQVRYRAPIEALMAILIAIAMALVYDGQKSSTKTLLK